MDDFLYNPPVQLTCRWLQRECQVNKIKLSASSASIVIRNNQVYLRRRFERWSRVGISRVVVWWELQLQERTKLTSASLLCVALQPATHTHCTLQIHSSRYREFTCVLFKLWQAITPGSGASGVWWEPPVWITDGMGQRSYRKTAYRHPARETRRLI